MGISPFLLIGVGGYIVRNQPVIFKKGLRPAYDFFVGVSACSHYSISERRFQY